MADPSDEGDIELVRRAILSGTRGDCEWKDESARKVRRDRDMEGFTPEGIRELLRVQVAAGGKISRKRESREEYTQECWYRVVIPVKEFKHGLFVEIILVDDDPETPQAQIVSAHEQRK